MESLHPLSSSPARAIPGTANIIAVARMTCLASFLIGQAQRAFERALEIDARSVEARIGIAAILTTRLGTGSSSSVQQDEARAERLLVEALERDANRAMAHEVMGMLRRIQNRLIEARIEFEAAIALDRNDAHALLSLGQTLMFLGRPEAGIT